MKPALVLLTILCTLLAGVFVAVGHVRQFPLARVVTLTPRKITEPTIQRRSTRDGYLIENPLKYPVRVKLNCGSEWEPITIDIKANNWDLIEVIDRDGKPVTLCFIERWEKKL